MARLVNERPRECRDEESPYDIVKLSSVVLVAPTEQTGGLYYQLMPSWTCTLL